MLEFLTSNKAVEAALLEESRKEWFSHEAKILTGFMPTRLEGSKYDPLREAADFRGVVLLGFFFGGGVWLSVAL